MSKARDYGQQRRLDDPQHPGNKPRRPRGKKDTKRWCRGKIGVEHQPILWYRSFTLSFSRRPVCGPMTLWIANADPGEWMCRHIEKCAVCGKVLRHLDDDECPDRARRKGGAEDA